MRAVNLESERLVLKKLSLEHLSQDYVDWLNDPLVYRYMETRGNYTLEKLENFLKEQAEKDILFWAIHLKDSFRHIGNIKIDPVNEANFSGEYGIMIGDRNAWGKNYAKEASILVLRYFFDSLNLEKVTLGVIDGNKSAFAMYKNLGFTIESTKEVSGYVDNETNRSVRMVLLNKDFVR